MKRLKPLLIAAMLAAAFLANAIGAQAATTIGATATPSASGICSTESSIQLRSPGAHYAAPFSGVVTAWSYQASNKPPQLKLKVANFLSEEHTALPGYPYNKATFQIVGESGAETPMPNALSTFGTRIRISAGDLIGLTPLSGGECFINSRPGYEMAFGGAAPVGSTSTFSVKEDNETQIDVSARLERDADGDGYGDETQDGCPTNAATQGPCPVPPSPIRPSTPSPIRPSSSCHVPSNLTGKRLKQAKAAIRQAKCSVGKITRLKRPKRGPFVVVRISADGAVIGLTLKRKPQPKRS